MVLAVMVIKGAIVVAMVVVRMGLAVIIKMTIVLIMVMKMVVMLKRSNCDDENGISASYDGEHSGDGGNVSYSDGECD